MEGPDELIEPWINFTKFHRRLNKALDHVLQQQYHLNLNEYYLLYHLSKAEQGQLRLSELKPKIGLSHSALSRLVTRLEHFNKKIITKSTYDEDKRSNFIKITNEGEKLLISISETLNVTLNNSLSPQDKDVIKIINL